MDGTKEKGRKGMVVNSVGSRAGARDEDEAIQRAEDWLMSARGRSKRGSRSAGGREERRTGEDSGGARERGRVRERICI